MRERFNRVFAALAVLLAFIAFCPRAFAQEVPPRESLPAKASTPQGDKWEVEVTPYFWAASLRGDITIKGLDSNVNIKFLDLAEYVDVGGMAHVEARKGNWGIFTDGIYLKAFCHREYGHSTGRACRRNLEGRGMDRGARRLLPGRPVDP